jgi:hypothetical protein
MPVTAKLSRRFYDRFGDEIANELVDWMNAVDAAYRSDLRETNELNFGRFMAWVGQQFAEQDARIERRFAEQDAKMEKRFAEQDARMEKRFAEQDGKMERGFAAADVRFAAIDGRFAAIDVRFAELRADLLKWMFIYWTGTMLTLAGFVFAMLQRR